MYKCLFDITKYYDSVCIVYRKHSLPRSLSNSSEFRRPGFLLGIKTKFVKLRRSYIDRLYIRLCFSSSTGPSIATNICNNKKRIKIVGTYYSMKTLKRLAEMVRVWIFVPQVFKYTLYNLKYHLVQYDDNMWIRNVSYWKTMCCTFDRFRQGNGFVTLM